MTHELASLIQERFIARRTAKAVQRADGTYHPARDEKGADLPFTMTDLYHHLDGNATYGHYVLDEDSRARMFCLDFDFANDGAWVHRPDVSMLVESDMTNEQVEQWFAEESRAIAYNPREAWRDRSHPARNWQKHKMHLAAMTTLGKIRTLLDLPCAAAYSGNKGIHVYGFTGLYPATEVREAGLLVLESLGDFTQGGGVSWRDTNTDPEYGFAEFTVEVFPKQSSLSRGGYGNLLRLPLGRNLKNPADPCFFLDINAPGTLAPHPDPVRLLTDGDPWK